MQVIETSVCQWAKHCLGWDIACGVCVSSSPIRMVVETCNDCICPLQQTDGIEGTCCCIAAVETPRNHFPTEDVREGKRTRWVSQTSLLLCPGISNLLGLWSFSSSALALPAELAVLFPPLSTAVPKLLCFSALACLLLPGCPEA